MVCKYCEGYISTGSYNTLGPFCSLECRDSYREENRPRPREVRKDCEVVFVDFKAKRILRRVKAA